jgi:hypothetical protein
VIGAGIAGLACAQRLRDHEIAVTLHDKGRRPGGRVATRLSGPFAFDHGAQFLTATDPRCLAWLHRGHADGFVAPWPATIVHLAEGVVGTSDDRKQRWVGVPGMNALARSLSSDLPVRASVRIKRIERHGRRWRLTAVDAATVDEADIVVVAVPAPQAMPLLEAAPHLAGRVAEASLRPCWAVMAGFEAALPLAFDGATVGAGPLAWICRNASKSGRGDHEAWVLHASAAWSERHLEAEPATVANDLLAALAAVTGCQLPAPAFAAAHRWRYALADRPLGEACLFDPDLGLGACGDWCLGGKIEAAFLSGLAMAERIVDSIGAVDAARTDP